MLYDYVALLLFIAFAIFIPVSFLLAAKLIGRKESGNAVKNSPYESGEETIGSSRDIENEYLPYFMMFLPFEVIVAILILWSTTTRQMSYGVNIMIISLAVFAAAISLVGYKMIKLVR
jgi:NADH:ubiquinone oxidoreductase subunit 3 (subunit A)